MSKAKNSAAKRTAASKSIDVGAELIAGMENALARVQGRKRAARSTVVHVRVPDRVDVAAIRAKVGLSQRAFAARFGFELKSVQNWEQGVRQPEGPARVLLTVIDRDPEAVERALSAA
jgi:putative transcriptional regulator